MVGYVGVRFLRLVVDDLNTYRSHGGSDGSDGIFDNRRNLKMMM